MANIVVSIGGDGSATYLVNEHTRDLFPEAQEPRRASHVVPWSLWSRFAFRALRAAFGEDGAVGAWTRTWRGPWMLDMRPAGGPCGMVFAHRDCAIEFEIDWLNCNFLGR